MALDDLAGFIRLDEAHDFDAWDGVVVVPSRRLKEAVRETVDLRARRAGRDSWTSPRVMTGEEWVVDRYQTAVAAGLTPGRRLLSGESLRVAVAAAASDDDTRLFALFETGWQLVHDFELNGEVPGFDDHEGARTWRRWALRFRDEAERNGWVTLPELPALLATLYTHPRTLPATPCMWLGFEHTPPSWSRLHDAASHAGHDIGEVALAGSGGSAPRIASCADSVEELKVAIDWAVRLLEAGHAHQRVGIVVPDLMQRYDEVLYHLTAAFGRGAPDARESLFNLSGGLPLTSVQVCADAFDLLRFCLRAESPTTVGRLLASPFFMLDTGGAASRQPTLPSRYDLRRFVTTTAHATAATIERQVRRWPRTQPLSQWIAQFRDVLRAAGWPGNTSTSETFQAVNAFESLLEELSLASDIVPACGAPQALQSIVAGGARRPFAPERGAAPLQVLGYLESAGLAFTHLWVTGLTANAWPAAPRVHPLIPRRWQLARGVPRVTVQQELDFARRMIHGWSVAANEVVMSYPRLEEGEPATVTALLPASAITRQISRHAAPPTDTKRGDVLEPDIQVVPETPGGILVMSAATIRDQSLCPFRAFAIHRLAVKEPRAPSSFPGADERGTILHEALDIAYHELSSSGELVALSPEGRITIATRAVDAALSATLRARAPAIFLETERQRLVAGLLAWFAVDVQRPEFVCETREAVYETSLAGVHLRVRIDRIDRDAATGDSILIDYKSGAVSPNLWRGDRPEDPQLPLYAAVVPGASEVAFAEVRGGASRMNGVTGNGERYASPIPAIRMHTPASFGADDWSSLVGRWRAIAGSLADEHRRGVAEVKPLHPGVCRRCHLQTFCRITDYGAADVE